MHSLVCLLKGNEENHICVCTCRHTHTVHTSIRACTLTQCTHACTHACTLTQCTQAYYIHASIYLDAYVNMSMFACSQVYKYICVHEAYTFMCKPMGVHACGHICTCLCVHTFMPGLVTDKRRESKSERVYSQTCAARQHI